MEDIRKSIIAMDIRIYYSERYKKRHNGEGYKNGYYCIGYKKMFYGEGSKKVLW